MCPALSTHEFDLFVLVAMLRIPDGSLRVVHLSNHKYACRSVRVYRDGLYGRPKVA